MRHSPSLLSSLRTLTLTALLVGAGTTLTGCSDSSDGGGGVVGPTDTSTTSTTTPTSTTTATAAGGGASVPVDGLTAVQAAAAMGKGFNLGQMFENTQHPRTFEAAQAKIDAYYAKGFRTVRVPVTWTEAVGGDTLVNDPTVGDVNRAHARLAVIEQVVDYALGKEMTVVLNAHHERTLKDQNRAAVLERLWADIADIFGDRDHRLIFELINEPHLEDGTTYSAMPVENVRAMTALAYAKVRAADPKRIIVIGGNRWFAADELAKVWTNLEGVGNGEDPYLMATFHHYNPWTFCGDNQGDYADPWTEAQIEGPMTTAQQWANGVGGGMPVYIGEWGVGWQSVLPTMDCNNIRAYYQAFDAQFASAKGIPTMVWDDGGWFRSFSHSTNTFENNLVDCILGECPWTGTERFNEACVPVVP